MVFRGWLYQTIAMISWISNSKPISGSFKLHIDQVLFDRFEVILKALERLQRVVEGAESISGIS